MHPPFSVDEWLMSIFSLEDLSISYQVHQAGGQKIKSNNLQWCHQCTRKCCLSCVTQLTVTCSLCITAWEYLLPDLKCQSLNLFHSTSWYTNRIFLKPHHCRFHILVELKCINILWEELIHIGELNKQTQMGLHK